MSRIAKPDLSQDIEILTRELGSFTPSADLIAEKYLGIKSHDQVVSHIAKGAFPLPVFKLRDSNKAPYLVHIRSLAEHLFELQSEAV